MSGRRGGAPAAALLQGACVTWGLEGGRRARARVPLHPPRPLPRLPPAQNIRVARDSLCALIMGSPPGKVYSRLRSVCARLNDS